MLIQIALIALATILAVTSLCCPSALSDSGNSFLRGFVNQELLATLGVIVSITLASAGNMHMELGKLAKLKSVDLARERQAVRASAYMLICQFIAALALVTLKPVLAHTDRATAFANSFGILIICWSIAILYDLTRAAFSISE